MSVVAAVVTMVGATYAARESVPASDSTPIVSHPTGLVLNKDKTVVIRTADLLVTGLKTLGTYVGPLDKTVAFLKQKVDAHIERISTLEEEEVSINTKVRIFDVCLRTELFSVFRTLDPSFAHWTRLSHTGPVLAR